MEAENLNKSLHKALLVLMCFSPNELEMGTNEIARRVGMSKTTSHRILKTLTEYKILEQNGNTGKYRIGPELYALGSLYLSTTDVLKAAEPVTKTLNDLTGETVLMGIFDKGNVIMVLKEESKHAFRFARHIGSLLPAYASAMGKAFLSELTEAEIDNLYPEEELQKIAPQTIATKTELKRNLEEIGKTGVSFTREEGYIGAAAIASLIRDADGKTVAAMTIPVPLYSMNQARREQLATLVKMGCSLISYRLGYQDKVNPVRDIEEICSWFEQNRLDSAF